jgi:hypothetical protein
MPKEVRIRNFTAEQHKSIARLALEADSSIGDFCRHIILTECIHHDAAKRCTTKEKINVK